MQVLFCDAIDIIDRLYKLTVKVRSPTSRTGPSARNFYRDKYVDAKGKELMLTREERVEAREQSEKFHERRIEDIVRQLWRDLAGTPSPSQLRVEKFTGHTRALIK